MSFTIKELLPEDNRVLIKRNLWAKDQQVADLVLEAMQEKLPCGYGWVEDTHDIKLTEIDEKNGQARTGDIITDVKRYTTRYDQIITHVIVDNNFKKPGFDQKINTWRDDPANEIGVELVREKGTRTLENIRYATAEAFLESASRRRTAIQKMTNNVSAGRRNLDLRVPTIAMITIWFTDFMSRTSLLNKIDLYELCARFGKTIFALSAFAISGRSLMIFGAYYQSAFASIIDDVSLFYQFENMKVVDGRAPGAEKLTKQYIKQGFKVVLLAGVHARNDWESHYQWVHNWDKNDKLGFFDEIDFGITTDKVSAKVKYLLNGAYGVMMSGSNIDRAEKNFSKLIDKYRVYTYEEMLETRSFLQSNPDYAETKLNELIKLIENYESIH